MNLLLGISGGIAAYKCVELARLLVKAGHQVQVVMTRAAHEFVAPASLQAVTGREVRSDLFDPAHEAAMGHIELARWADRVLIAPASANVLAHLAQGFADDLLSTLCLATTATIAVAPAMNNRMWGHPATQANLATLRERGVQVLGPAEGEQACGEVGPGRMLEPVELVELIDAPVERALAGVTALVTAGPTHEALDPVRFIGNRSSGRMGFAIAESLRSRGAEVVLVHGPVSVAPPARIEAVAVSSAMQMRDAVFERIDAAQVFVACAAVADYRPAEVAPEKIKKGQAELSLRLVRNPDILAEVAALPDTPFTLGFAAETENVRDHAEAKRQAKRLNMIAANEVGAGLGFEVEDNALLVLWDGGERQLGPGAKTDLADSLVDLLIERLETGAAH